jgi:hypothetical protein
VLRGEIVWAAPHMPQGILRMVLANGVKLEAREFFQSLIEPLQLQFNPLHREMSYPLVEKLPGHSVISVSGGYCAPGV